MLLNPLIEQLQALRLRGMAAALTNQLASTQADGLPFEEGKTYKAKDYLPGQRVYVKKEMTPEELLAAVLANPELLARVKAAG